MTKFWPIMGSLGVCLFALCGCEDRVVVCPPRASKPSQAVKNFLGDKAVEVLEDATKVAVFRIDPKDRKDPKDEKELPKDRVGGYKVTATEKDQDAKFAARLNAVLFDEKTYLFDLAKGCKFEPGVAFRLWKGKEVVEVLLCFSCDELRVLTRDDKGKLVKSSQEDFDPARAVLVKLAKEAFPKDALIQGLKEKGR